MIDALIHPRRAGQPATHYSLKNTRLAAALALALCAPLPVWAQPATGDNEAAQAPPAETAAVNLPAVEVSAAKPEATTEGTLSYTTGETSAATGLPLSLRDTPQSVTVVTQQRMEDQQMTAITDVLNNSTGISSYALDGAGGRVSFYSRGFEITNFNYDGVPTAALPNTFVPGDGIQDAAFYDRVEIVRGATGLLSGTGNPSASINLVRKRPTKDFAASASISAGSWDNYREAVDISTPLTVDGRIRARVVAVNQNSHSFLDRYKLKRQSLYGVVDADLTSSTTLSVGYQYSHSVPKGMPWGGQPLFFSDGSTTHWPRSTNMAANWSTWDSTLKTAFANLEQRFDNGWKLRAEFSQKRANADSRLLSVLGYPDKLSGQGLIPVAAAGLLDTRQNNFDVMATGPFRLFGRKHELVIGAMASNLNADDHETGFVFPRTPIGNFYDWNGNYPEPDFNAASYTLTRTRVKQSGFYSAARFSLSDRAKLIVGGRFSNYEVDQHSETSSFHDKTTAKFVPYVGLVYDLNDTYSAYASYTAIFNPQTYRDRNGGILSPTTGKNVEVGLKGEYLDGRLNASIALFQAKLDNVAQIDAGQLLPDGTQAYYAASGTQSKGVDVDVQGEVAQGWNVYAGVSHFTASNGDGSRMSSQIPRTTARLFTTYRLSGAWARLTVGGGVNWQSRFYQSAVSPNGTVEVGQSAYATASLMARYELTKHATVSMNVNNVFDRRYYAMTGFYNQALYGEPRNFMVTLSYKL